MFSDGEKTVLVSQGVDCFCWFWINKMYIKCSYMLETFLSNFNSGIFDENIICKRNAIHPLLNVARFQYSLRIYCAEYANIGPNRSVRLLSGLVSYGLMTPGLSKDIRCHVWPYVSINLQISRSDIRPHIKWAVSLVILHMVTSIFLWGLCGYIWVNILTLSPQRVTSLRTFLHVYT